MLRRLHCSFWCCSGLFCLVGWVLAGVGDFVCFGGFDLVECV